MTSVDEQSTRPQRVSLYVVVGAVLGGLLVAGYLLHRPARLDAAAVCADPYAALVRAANVSAGGPGLLPPEAVRHAHLRVLLAHCHEKAG
ncbi:MULTISPECIES: hypothetical protein [unclassified Amycolatopsis]|uniref:hypothetical protein n=1 Tax=unclassified Amycolatopsis TaxID=2618356 RepID=UPI0028753D18|nr:MULTISPECIES: hypothetical protein [unclassified Amycolatopsis]MDS0140345.1 hypothetical protein [Amycolatopsis sp. 505]MDS0149051.1 hypothetical protein [Amycolatopsis sp. CM201R]